MNVFHHFPKTKPRKCFNLSKGHPAYFLREMLLIDGFIANMSSVETQFKKVPFV
jgi:hypothetical protein